MVSWRSPGSRSWLAQCRGPRRSTGCTASPCMSCADVASHREHLSHHADVTYFSPTPKKLASAAGTTVVASPGHGAGRSPVGHGVHGGDDQHLLRLRGRPPPHPHPPAAEPLRQIGAAESPAPPLGAPMRNFGVTSPCGTRCWAPTTTRGCDGAGAHGAGVDVDELGRVRPELAGDYVVKGSRSADERRAGDRSPRSPTQCPRSDQLRPGARLEPPSFTIGKAPDREPGEPFSTVTGRTRRKVLGMGAGRGARRVAVSGAAVLAVLLVGCGDDGPRAAMGRRPAPPATVRVSSVAVPRSTNPVTPMTAGTTRRPIPRSGS